MRQIALIHEITTFCSRAGIEHWLRGGWAVDFAVGRLTREHEDIDLFAWAKDLPRLLPLLAQAHFLACDGPPPDAQRDFTKHDEIIQIALLATTAQGQVGPAGGPWAGTPWPEGMLEGPPGRLGEVTCPIVNPQVQIAIKELFRQARPWTEPHDKHDDDILQLRALVVPGDH